MICKQCGTDNSESARFCKGCGAPLEAATPTPTPAPPATNFCPNCGVENAAGAAFCKSCGTQLAAAAQQGGMQVAMAQVGGAAASKMNAFKQSTLAANILPMIKMSFKQPLDAIRRGCSDQENWLGMVIVWLAKALLIALILTMKAQSLISNIADKYNGREYLSQIKEELNNELGLSMGKVFIGALLISLLIDAAFIMSYFLIGKAFGANIAPKSWFGAVTPAIVIGACGSTIAILLMITGSSGFKAALVVTAIIGIWQIVLYWKAFEIALKMDEAKQVYAFIIATVVGMIASYIAGKLVMATVFAKFNTIIQEYKNAFGEELTDTLTDIFD